MSHCCGLDCGQCRVPSQPELPFAPPQDVEDGYSWGIPRDILMRWNDPEPKAPDFPRAVSKVYQEAEDLLLRKHRDYGPKNISESPGGPLNGLRVRMHDKVARLNNLLDSGAKPENESLEDTFVDILNYSAIALLVLRGEWPQ